MFLSVIVTKQQKVYTIIKQQPQWTKKGTKNYWLRMKSRCGRNVRAFLSGLVLHVLKLQYYRISNKDVDLRINVHIERILTKLLTLCSPSAVLFDRFLFTLLPSPYHFCAYFSLGILFIFLVKWHRIHTAVCLLTCNVASSDSKHKSVRK